MTARAVRNVVLALKALACGMLLLCRSAELRACAPAADLLVCSSQLGCFCIGLLLQACLSCVL